MTSPTEKPEHKAWYGMIRRCHLPSHAAFANYGGRGITVCKRWRESFSTFLQDMGERPGPGFEIDRIDNSQGYSPDNCRWATVTTNARNRRSNRKITAFGETLLLVEWAEKFGLNADTISKRLDSGWDAERAISAPARSKAAKGQAEDLRNPCVECGTLSWGERCKSCENKRRWRDGQYD